MPCTKVEDALDRLVDIPGTVFCCLPIELCACNSSKLKRIYSLYGDYTVKMTINRQNSFLLGRYCAHACMNKLRIAEKTITASKFGMPIFESVSGSIAHSNTHAIACLSNSKSIFSVGIDIENIVSNQDAVRLVNFIFTKVEYNRFWIASQYPKKHIFTLIFSLKESIYKAISGSIKKPINFKMIEIIEIDYINSSAKFLLHDDYSKASGRMYITNFTVCRENIACITIGFYKPSNLLNLLNVREIQEWKVC